MVSDATATVATLLSNNWTASNTDEKTPTIDEVYERKEISVATGDWILTYNTDLDPRFNGVGSSNLKKEYVVTIDIRSGYRPDKDSSLSTPSTVTGHKHLLKMVEEVERIIKAKKIDPGSPFETIQPHGRAIDHSDRRKRLYRFTYEVKLKETNT